MDSAITVLADHTSSVPGTIDGDKAVVATDALVELLGWELKPEGLCQNDACVPVPDQAALIHGDGIDVTAVAAALGRPAIVDSSIGAVVVGTPAATRAQALKDRRAPNFTLPDLNGVPQTLAGWTGKKRLLVAFSSW